MHQLIQNLQRLKDFGKLKVLVLIQLN